MPILNESVLVLKPDAAELSVIIEKQTFGLHHVAAGLLVAAQLEIIDRVTYQLKPYEVYQIYEKVLRPNPEDDAQWGTAWKKDVIDHMTSGPVDAFFVYHSEAGTAEQKTKGLRDFLRKNYVIGHQVVKNLAHVPEEDEFTVARSILLQS